VRESPPESFTATPAAGPDDVLTTPEIVRVPTMASVDDLASSVGEPASAQLVRSERPPRPSHSRRRTTNDEKRMAFMHVSFARVGDPARELFARSPSERKGKSVSDRPSASAIDDLA
jgi:hypothetical protein